MMKMKIINRNLLDEIFYEKADYIDRKGKKEDL